MDLIDREQLKSTIRKMVEIPNETRVQVIGAISRAKAVDGWIPVTDRLPEDTLPRFSEVKQIKVLTALKSEKGVRTVRSQMRYRDSWCNEIRWRWKYSGSKITHWMPLPEPPKGE